MLKLGFCIISVIVVLVQSAPRKTLAAGGSAEIGGDIPSLFTFDNGNIGVNFLGFKASAGLGGLLSGGSGVGGLHAEAETPFGQSAKAGLGGQTSSGGKTVGGLYADASAGGDIAAGAGIAGSSGHEGSYGMSYAGSSSGGIVKGKIKEKTSIESYAPVKVNVKPQKTYIERTVIPNYEEKTIFVPSYVEKTVRVPTVVEKKVKVPVAPTVIEKEVQASADVNFQESEVQIVEHAPIAHKVIQKHRIHGSPFFQKHFFIGSSFGGGFGGEGNGAGYSTGGISGSKSISANAHLDKWIL